MLQEDLVDLVDQVDQVDLDHLAVVAEDMRHIPVVVEAEVPTEVVSIVFQFVFNLKCKNYKYNAFIKYLLVAYFTSTSIEYSIINRYIRWSNEIDSIGKSIVRYNRNNKFENSLNYFSKILKLYFKLLYLKFANYCNFLRQIFFSNVISNRIDKIIDFLLQQITI